MKVDVVAALVKAVREKRMGDIAALKTVVAEPHENPDIRERVRGFMDLTLKPMDINALTALPRGTLGHAYAEFMRRYNLGVVNLSPEWAHIYTRFPLCTRVTKTHDIFHALLGCDATVVGELGTYAFCHAQQYSGMTTRGYHAAKKFYALSNPLKRERLRSAEQWGLEQGRRAVCLVEQPLEELVGEDLTKLRERFGITPFSADC